MTFTVKDALSRLRERLRPGSRVLATSGGLPPWYERWVRAAAENARHLQELECLDPRLAKLAKRLPWSPEDLKRDYLRHGNFEETERGFVDARDLAVRNPWSAVACKSLLDALAGDVELAQQIITTDTMCGGGAGALVGLEQGRLRAGGDLRPGQSVERMEAWLRREWEAARAARGGDQ